MIGQLSTALYLRIVNAVARPHDEQGQTLAEYALIMSVVAIAVIVAALTAFRDNIMGAFNMATDCLSGSTC